MSVACAACGSPPAAPYPFRCPRSGCDDGDHLIRRTLDWAPAWPAGLPAGSPFEHYRSLLLSHRRAVVGGLGDQWFVDTVGTLDASVASVDGRGFRATPFALLDDAIWVKDETGNVAGSHKGRHLMGILLHLAVSVALGEAPGDEELAIASCGNAALAAAVLARAAGRSLRVFVPADADAAIVIRLADLGAEVNTCRRDADAAGDPCVTRLSEALALGAIPFTCQGPLNGMAIEGGSTLAYELVSSGVPFDHLVVQVGGGALASACAQGLAAAGASPTFHTVQTSGAHPLERAYHRILDSPLGVEGALADAAVHRSTYMWPWESEPHSVATGILDDETYDWRAVVAAMAASGGQAVVASEPSLAAAHTAAVGAGYAASPTGAAGLAGVGILRQQGAIPPGDRVAVLMTG